MNPCNLVHRKFTMEMCTLYTGSSTHLFPDWVFIYHLDALQGSHRR